MYQGLAKNTCNVSVMGSIPIVSTTQLYNSWWLTARNRRAFWSGGVIGNTSHCHCEDCGFDPRADRL
jgi:hypothetical protein